MLLPVMSCKISKNNQNCGNGGKSNKIKSKLACILEARESTRLRMGEKTILQDRRQFTAASHSSTESEIISLDAGLRLDGTGKPAVCRDKNHVCHQSRGMINVFG